jgi:hypothetical protein
MNKNVLFSIFILYYYTKKIQSRRKLIILDFTLNSSTICSVNNGMSRCMFINANPFNRDRPVVFLSFLNV